MSVIGSSGAKRPRGARHKVWEAADLVVVAAILLVAAILAIFVFLCFQGYDSTIRESKVRAERAASVVGLGSRWMISSILSALDAAASSQQALSQIESVFEKSSFYLPGDMSVATFDGSGMAVGAPSGAPTDISTQDYFIRLSQGQDWALGAQEATTQGNAAFAVAKSITGEGAFRGAVVVLVDSRILETLAAPQDLGDGSTVSLIRNDGWVIGRSPPLDAATNLAGTPAMESLTATRSGSYESIASPVDGISRFVGFEHVPELGYIAVASIAQSTALAELWYAIWVVSLLLAPIAIAVLAGSLVTANLLRKTQAARTSLASALEHNEELFKEIHHRVKNNLQSINSLLQLHPIPRETRDDISKRIFAMSAVHEHIYRSNAFEDVHVKDYLHKLIQNIREGSDPRITIVENLEDVIVEKDAAAPLGLVLSEVLTNSMKHAFPQGAGGTINVSLSMVAEAHAELVVLDDGAGYDVNAPSKGIGRRLVRGFAAQVGGEPEYTVGQGSRFALKFPARTLRPAHDR